MSWFASPTLPISAGWRSLLTDCRSSGDQLAVDTTIVSTLHANGEARRAHEDGAALIAARRVKERRYLELVGRPGRARLVAGRGSLWPFVTMRPSHS